MSEPSIDPSKSKCVMCAKEIPTIPGYTYQFRNAKNDALLFIQYTKVAFSESDKSKPDFEPAPVCLSCVQKIIGQALATASVPEASKSVIEGSEN